MKTQSQTQTKTTNRRATKRVLSKLVRAQETGNMTLFSSCFSHMHNVTFIGTDIDEYWDNWNEFQEYMTQMIKLRKGLKITEKGTKINFSSDETIAWFSQMVDTCIETKGEPFRLEGFRHTGIMQKERNEWKIVQFHTSIAVNGIEDSGIEDNRYYN